MKILLMMVKGIKIIKIKNNKKNNKRIKLEKNHLLKKMIHLFRIVMN